MEIAAVLLALTYVLGYAVMAMTFCSALAFAFTLYRAFRAIPIMGTDRHRIVPVIQVGGITSLLMLAGSSLVSGSEYIRDSAGWQTLLAGDSSAFRASWPAQIDVGVGVLYIAAGLASLMLIGRVNRTARAYRRSIRDPHIASPRVTITPSQ